MNPVPVPGVQSRSRLYLATFSASLLYVSTGCVMSWPSPTLPRLEEEGLVNEVEGAWIASVYGLGAACGPAIVAIAIDSVGRKVTLLLVMLAFIISWLILGLSTNVYAMYVGRIVGGVGVGGSFSGVSVYLAEIADDEVRGAIGSLNQMFVGFGFLVQYCVGPYVSYTSLVIVSACAAIAFGILFVFMPESPHYLLNTGQKQKASDALRWLRGNVQPFAVERELTTIEGDLEEAKLKSGSLLDLFRKRGPRTALGVCCYLMLCQQVSGMNAVVSYTQTIFQMAHMELSSTVSPMLVGAVNCLSSCFAPPLVKRLGLKPVLIVSGIAMGLCSVLLAVYFFVLASGNNVESISLLPVFCLMLFNVFYCIGVGPLPWTVAAEMFPASLKGLANCLIGAFSWLLAFAVMRSYSDMAATVGPATVFLLYGLLLISGMAGASLILPNTRGLSLQDIQDLLNGRKSQEMSSVEKIGYF